MYQLNFSVQSKYQLAKFTLCCSVLIIVCSADHVLYYKSEYSVVRAPAYTIHYILCLIIYEFLIPV